MQKSDEQTVNEASTTPEVEQPTETLTCPGNLVGKLIGRQGETISIIQAYSGCKVQVHHKEEGDPKKVSITGPQEAFGKVRDIIEQVLFQDKNLNDEKREIDCPAELVGKIIGKAGDTIKSLQVASAAKIHVNQDATPRKINISGRLDQVEIASKMINELITSENVTVQHVINNHARMIKITEKCSKNFVGKIIGKGGQNIKDLNRKTRARIQIDQTLDPCIITIQGPEKAAQTAQQEIRELIQSLQMPQQQGNQGYGLPGSNLMNPYNSYSPQTFGVSTYMTQGSQNMGGYSQYYQQPNMIGGYPYQNFGGAQAGGGASSGGGAGLGTWQEHKDQNGRVYYFNRITNSSQWEKPADLI